MEIIESRENLYAAIYREIGDRSPDEVRELCRDKSSRLAFLVRLNRRYDRAFEASRKFGFVGVGKYVFAEKRMVEFQHRISRNH